MRLNGRDLRPATVIIAPTHCNQLLHEGIRGMRMQRVGVDYYFFKKKKSRRHLWVGARCCGVRLYVGHKVPGGRPCCWGIRTTASCCHRHDTHIACALEQARTLETTMRLRAGQRFAATSVGRSSVLRSPLVGHKVPGGRPCCWGTRLAPHALALADARTERMHAPSGCPHRVDDHTEWMASLLVASS